MNDRAQIELDRLVKIFESGEAPAIIAKTVLPCPEMPSNHWTLCNRLLAFAQTMQADCRGFKQWQTAGRHVKKGEKAAYILKPLIVKRKNDETQEDESKLVGFTGIPVFPQSATDGEPLPELKPQEAPPLYNVAQALNINVDYQGFVGGYYGMCRTDGTQITLCTHDEQTFFHELSHAAHRRIKGANLEGGQDPKQEIVAELCACVLARMYGRKTANEGYTFEYIKRYADTQKKKIGNAIVSVLSDAGKVLDLIIQTAQADILAKAA